MANQKLKIDFTAGDIEELKDGRTFDWTFTTDKGEDIDVHIYNEDFEEEVDEDEVCQMI